MRLALLMAGITALALGAVGCAETSDDTGEAAASCAYVIDYDNRHYSDVANIDYRLGEKLGTATQPPCDDTPGHGDDGEPAHRITAYAVQGLDPAIAIAVGDAPDDVILVAVREGGELPPEIDKLPRLAPEQE
ncbi:putative secreted protein [Streptomyces davaonensis JCM 4913]|uniref:Putative secreted protein n=1 Tax=Streptomyces davaonensis (strain DSM 101723 / JCM 4913 / KCC S-0913 / 768) TaxID=1214101 RepID=K4R5C2_STRDJ|nr:DUF6281 family protein [Streptomyces davaonensis]CCK28280.1 putative secreted protein [Streptomyces davaonensis JCM 4913]